MQTDNMAAQKLKQFLNVSREAKVAQVHTTVVYRSEYGGTQLMVYCRSLGSKGDNP